ASHTSGTVSNMGSMSLLASGHGATANPTNSAAINALTHHASQGSARAGAGSKKSSSMPITAGPNAVIATIDAMAHKLTSAANRGWPAICTRVHIPKSAPGHTPITSAAIHSGETTSGARSPLRNRWKARASDAGTNAVKQLANAKPRIRTRGNAGTPVNAFRIGTDTSSHKAAPTATSGQ